MARTSRPRSTVFSLATLAAGVLVGIWVGSVPARREASRVEQELTACQSEPQRSPSPLQALLRLPEPTRVPSTPAGSGSIVNEPERPGPREAPRPVEAPPRSESSIGRGARARFSREQLDAALDAQRVRAAQTRSVLIEEAALEPTEIARLDAAVEAMNRSLTAPARRAVQLLERGDQREALPVLELTHEASGVLVTAQAEVDALLGGRARVAIWDLADLRADELMDPPREGI